MAFRIHARTILQLGAELISSDAVAFYELIKNSFDAGSKAVKLRIICLLPHAVCNAYLDQIDETINAGYPNERARATAHSTLLKSLKSTVGDHFFVEDKLSRVALRQLDGATALVEFSGQLKACNSIEIEDDGSGMSLVDLDNIFLTIGTRARYVERQAALAAGQHRVLLGEKGIGRLSAMRLGRELSVVTTKQDEPNWNRLNIDWNIFSHDSDQFLGEVEVSPSLGVRKDSATQSGTVISISRLTSTWTRPAIDAMMAEQFSKLVDPFAEKETHKIFVRFNDVAIPRMRFDHALLEAAHAELKAEFVLDDDEGPCLRGRIDYRRFKKSRAFSLKGTHLLKGAKAASLAELSKVGPFTLQLYWFNRKYIGDTAGLEASYIRNLVRRWAGGVMVYRDGFRVNPYGGPEDDWLGLDRKALASGGYKLNRNQLIGKLDIEAAKNPALLDQTNREGIRDSEERKSLVSLLRFAILNEFKQFLDQVEEELEPTEPVSIEEVEAKVEKTKSEIKRSWKSLRRAHPEVEQSAQLVTDMDDALDELTDLLESARRLVLSYEKGKNHMVQLAGIGLMVEVVGHELNRATEHALRSLMESRQAGSTADFEIALDSLHAQLRTLQKRLRILDPLSVAGRQVKESFDLAQWIREIVDAHQAQFARHGIDVTVTVRGPGRDGAIRVKAVKGMIVQIVENLVANSVYWLKAEKVVSPSFEPRIKLLIDGKKNIVELFDNGPGVEPDRAEEIFRPFVTSKPPGEGKGLGLYIAQELAIYHGCSLTLSPTKGPNNTLSTFVLDISHIQH